MICDNIRPYVDHDFKLDGMGMVEARAPAPYWRDPRAWRLLRPRWRRSRPFPRIRPYYRRVPSTSFWARKPRMAPLKAPNGDLNAQKVSLGRFSSFVAKIEINVHASTFLQRLSELRAWFFVTFCLFSPN
jgi:hypothetical protein